VILDEDDQRVVWQIPGELGREVARRWRVLNDGIERLEAENARIKSAWSAQDAELDQILGRACGYPRYADDPRNFPGATGDDVCTGCHVPVTLAMEAAGRIAALTAEVERLTADNARLVREKERETRRRRGEHPS
jgi:uncharacterized small protein (DUF1192 family)